MKAIKAEDCTSDISPLLALLTYFAIDVEIPTLRQPPQQMIKRSLPLSTLGGTGMNLILLQKSLLSKVWVEVPLFFQGLIISGSDRPALRGPS